MLGVFSESVAKGPMELSSPSSHGDSRMGGMEILHGFVNHLPEVLHVVLKNVGGMAYTHHNHAMLSPRSFSVVDGIFCLFEGQLSNLTSLRHEYGLAKNVSEVMLVIEAYKVLRDRGPYPADQVVSSLAGHFAFLLFDSTNNNVFVAADREGRVPLYWGTAADRSLVFSNNADILKVGCGASFAPFPPGCYFSSHMGLQSFEHPLQQLSPVPRVNSQGHSLGASFKVGPLHKEITRQESMHRVGSEANWSESI